MIGKITAYCKESEQRKALANKIGLLQIQFGRVRELRSQENFAIFPII